MTKPSLLLATWCACYLAAPQLVCCRLAILPLSASLALNLLGARYLAGTIAVAPCYLTALVSQFALISLRAAPRAMVSIGGPLPGLCKGYTPYGLFAASGPWLHRMSQDPDITHQKERLVEILQAAWVIGNDTSDPKSLAAVFVQRILALATVPTLNAPNPGVDFINSNSLQAFLKLPGVHGNPHINVKGIRDALRDVMLPLRVFDALLHVLDRRAEPDVLMSIATECYAPEVPPSPPKHPIGSTLRTVRAVPRSTFV